MKKAYNIYMEIKKHISWKMCIFFVIWLIAVIYGFTWLQAHPDCTSFILSNIDEINGTTIYWVENATIPQYVEPPCAYHIWNFFNKGKPYLFALSASLLIFSYLTNRNQINQYIKKAKKQLEEADDD